MSDTIKALTEAVRFRVITASDPDYDEARAVYNAMHDRRPRWRLVLLALLASAALAGPRPAAAQTLTLDTRPDLTVSVVAAPNPVPADSTVTYTLTVRNRRPGGGFTTTGQLTPTQTATGVRVVQNLPSGIGFQSATGDSGFACAFAAPAVTCTGGAIPADGVATIRVAAIAYPSLLPRVSTITVDPLDAVAERDESNNRAAVGVDIALPDLTPSIERRTENVYAYGVLVGVRLIHTVTVRNTGPARATGVTADVTVWARPSLPSAGIAADRGLTCATTEVGSDWQIGWHTWRCTGGTVPAGAAATITVSHAYSWSWSVEAGTQAEVDPVVAVLESNEANNTAP